MTSQQLSNQTIFITGASSGIGAACAQLFAACGANLVLAARREERLRELADTISSAHNVKVHTICLDVRDRKMVMESIDLLPSDFKNIDILVNNAGLAQGLEPIAEGEIEDWETMIDTNMKGLLYVTRKVVPGMIQRGSGFVVNIGSVTGREVYPKGGVYSGTKHAVRAITEGLRIELLGTGVRVTCIDPGLVETEFSLVRFKGQSERAKQTYSRFKALEGKDIAEAILFCVTRPAHVDINSMLIMPSDQASTRYSVLNKS